MKPFLAEIAADLYRKLGADMSRTAIIFPNKRASIFMDEHFLDVMEDTPIWTPSYYSISEFYDILCPLKQDNPVRSIFLLYNAYKETLPEKDKTSLDINYFYSWGQQLLSDFNNIDKNMVDAKRILTNASDIWKLEDIGDDHVREKLQRIFLHKPDIPNTSEKSEESPSAIKKNFQQIWNNLYPIYKRFNEQLESRGEAYSGARYRIVTEGLEQETILLPDRYDTYIFIGFNILLASERRLMRFVKERKQTFFYWDCDGFFMENISKFSFCKTLRENISEFPNEIPFEKRTHIKDQTLDYISSSSNNAQAHFVTPWIKKNLTPKENRTAIVLCDESQLEAVLHSIPGNQEEKGVKEVNITKGFPLGNTPAYSYVCHFLKKELAKNPENLIPVLESLAENLRVQAEKKLASHPQNTWEGNLYAESFFRCYTSTVQLRDILEEKILPLKGNTLETLLLQILHSQSIPFQGEPAIGLQIMGMLETRSLDFDEILMLSVNEGNIPKKSTDHSFLPYDLRKAFHLTTLEQESEVYAYNFFRLLQRCKHITYIYNQAGEQNAEKSRFLQQLLINTNLKVREYILSEKQENTAHQYDGISSEEVKDLMNGVKKLAPTAVNHYIDCPMRFYFSDIARLTEDKQEQEILPPPTFGSIFHESARLCFKELMEGKNKDRYGYPISSSELKELAKDDVKIDRFLREAMFTIGGEDFLNSPENIKLYLQNGGKHGIERLSHNEKKQEGIAFLTRHPEMAPYKAEEHLVEFQVLKKYLKDTLSFDSQWEDLHIVTMEERHDTEVEGIAIGGYIDRLDVATINGSPTLRIVDYKTGNYDIKKTKVRMEDLFSSENYHYAVQTFIYSQACIDKKEPYGQGLPVAPILLFIQKTGNKEYSPYLKLAEDKDEHDILDFKEQVSAEFRTALEHLIRKMKTEEYTYNSEMECRNCAFTALCGKKTKENSYAL